MEWWIVELLIIFAGLLPDPTLSVAVTGICLNVISLVYMVSFGLSGGPACPMGTSFDASVSTTSFSPGPHVHGLVMTPEKAVLFTS